MYSPPVKGKHPIQKLILKGLRWSGTLSIFSRVLLAALLLVGGILGFLPILGFWMLPLGIAIICMCLPWTRHHIHQWMQRKERELLHDENE